MIQLSLLKALTIAAAIAVAVSGATFAVTRLAYDNLVSTLRLQVEVLDRRLSQVMNQSSPARNSVESERDPTKESDASPPAPPRLSVQYLSPRDGDMVPQFSDVEFKIVGQLPRGHRAVLLIRDPIGQYWSWGTSSSGKYPRIQFGIAEDTGRDFEVGILITTEELPVGRPTMARPTGLLYQHITVKRR